MFLLNAFSISMLDLTQPTSVSFTEVSQADAKTLAQQGLVSAVGHADTAAVFESILGTPVPTNRVSVALKPGDSALVGQYSGPRLPEGCKTLPEGASIKWVLVRV